MSNHYHKQAEAIIDTASKIGRAYRESIERDKQLAKLEKEVKAMRDAVPRWIKVEDGLPPAEKDDTSSRAVPVQLRCGTIAVDNYNLLDNSWEEYDGIVVRWLDGYLDT